MFESTSVQTIMNTFLSTYYGAGPVAQPIVRGSDFFAPSGHEFVFVNICGRATPMILPSAAVPTGAFSGAKASCKCNKGSGCTAQNKMGGYGCKAGKLCSSCSLVVATKLDDVDFMAFGSPYFVTEASAPSFTF
jgi:hypothetical protein